MSEFQSFESFEANADATPTGPAPGEKKSSTLALVSLIMGILSYVALGPIGGIAAVITGHMAMKEINQSGGALEGENLAKIGLILGYVNLVLSLCCCIGAAIWFFALASTSKSSALLLLLV